MKFFANAYTKSGIPDILCCCNGYFLGVEVKAPNGKPSELQKRNIRLINEEGGFGVILYPDQLDDFRTLIFYLRYREDPDEAREAVLKINERWDK